MRKLIALKTENGAAAVLFIMIFGAGFLFVLFALTADAGALYRERRTTQNAADLTALAVASYCALGDVKCATSESIAATAQDFANQNSDDKFTNLESICGFTPLSNCLNQAIVECKPVPENIQRYARLVINTKNQDGTNKVLTPFLGALLNNSNLSATFESCAQAAWGKANSAYIPIPLAITICDYESNGFKIMRDYSSQSPACPTTIRDVQNFVIEPQPRNVINGWSIYTPLGQPLLCLREQVLTVGNTIETLPPGQERCNDAGLSGSDSKRVLANFISANLGKRVFIPVIASTSGTGTGQAQRLNAPVVGFFTFVFYGYDLGAQIKDGCAVTSCPEFTGISTQGCGSQRGCIWGEFSRGIVPGVPVSRDTTFPPVGAIAIELMP